MSATTIAVATMTETVEPQKGSRPGHAVLPISDAAMSVRASGITPLNCSSCRPQYQQCLNPRMSRCFITVNLAPSPVGHLRHCEKTTAVPQSRHDFVFSEAAGNGEFFAAA